MTSLNDQMIKHLRKYGKVFDVNNPWQSICC